jgi:hypothetical protein
MNRLRLLSLASALFIFLLFSSYAVSISVWDKVSEDTPITEVYIVGYNTVNMTPPLDPLNNSGISTIRIAYPQANRSNETFKLSEWNLSKVLGEYQWGVKNYLPNISGKFSLGVWRKGYWNSSIDSWRVRIDVNHLTITLYTTACAGSGECDEYITFECWRDGTNVTCKWGKPVFKTYPSVPPIGRTTTTSETTSRTTTSSSSSQTTASPNGSTASTTGRKLCGPASLIGLALIPALLGLRRYGGENGSTLLALLSF